MDTGMNVNSSIARAGEPPGRHRPVAGPGREAPAAHAPVPDVTWHEHGIANDRGDDRGSHRSRGLRGLRGLHLGAEQSARVLALIQARQFELAVREVRALPAATPELPDLLGRLIRALAHAGEHDATIHLIAELLAQFPLRPELIGLLVGLADILTSEQHLTLVFQAVGLALRRTFDFQDAASFEWAQRLAYQLRRHGNAYASACILRTWHALMLN
jgi:hypothetical protein